MQLPWHSSVTSAGKGDVVLRLPLPLEEVFISLHPKTHPAVQAKPHHVVVWSHLYPGHVSPLLSCPGRNVPILVKSWSLILQEYFQIIEPPDLSHLAIALMSKSAQGRSGSLQLELKRKVREVRVASAPVQSGLSHCAAASSLESCLYPSDHRMLCMCEMK